MSYVRAGKLLKLKKAKDKRQKQNNEKRLNVLIKKVLLAEDYYNCIGYKYNR
ncbi:MAG: hypothetical protein WC346_17730 [Methanogenium sp.]|jgi:hypothetical protein